MISAHGPGRNAPQNRTHVQDIQACPFGADSPEWREWRNGFCDESVTSLK